MREFFPFIPYLFPLGPQEHHRQQQRRHRQLPLLSNKNRATKKDNKVTLLRLTAPQLYLSLLVLVSQPLLPGIPQLSQPLAHRHEFGKVDWQSPCPEQGMPL